MKTMENRMKNTKNLNEKAYFKIQQIHLEKTRNQLKRPIKYIVAKSRCNDDINPVN